VKWRLFVCFLDHSFYIAISGVARNISTRVSEACI